MVTALAFKTKVRSSKYKKARYAIKNFIEKDLSKIIKEFEKIGKLLYEKKRPDMSLLTATFISDKLNRHDHGSYTEMSALSSNINVMDEDK